MSKVEETICILVIIIFGLFYAMLIPPFEAPDEPAHFLRAYGMAEGQFILRDHPRAVVQYILDCLRKRPGRDSLLIIKDLQNLLIHQGERMPNIAFYSSQYSPLSYLHYAAAIKFLMLFNSNVDISFYIYFARFISVIIFSSLMSFVFKIAKNMSWIFYCVAATPMLLSQSGIINPDSLVCVTSFILLAFPLSVYMKRYNVLWMVLATFFLISSKPPYAPLFLFPLLTLFIRNKFPDAELIVGYFLAILSSILSVVIWSYFVKQNGIYDLMMYAIHRYNASDIFPDQQLMMLFKHPLVIFTVLGNTFRENGWSLINSFIGCWGWFEFMAPFWMVVLYGLVLFLGILKSSLSITLSSATSVQLGMIAVISAFLALIGVVTSIYMVWMPVGSPVVYLQGRYFHPIVASVLIGIACFKNVSIPSRFSPYSSFVLVVMSLVVQIAGCIDLFRIYHAR